MLTYKGERHLRICNAFMHVINTTQLHNQFLLIQSVINYNQMLLHLKIAIP